MVEFTSRDGYRVHILGWFYRSEVFSVNKVPIYIQVIPVLKILRCYNGQHVCVMCVKEGTIYSVHMLKFINASTVDIG